MDSNSDIEIKKPDGGFAGTFSKNIPKVRDKSADGDDDFDRDPNA